MEANMARLLAACALAVFFAGVFAASAAAEPSRSETLGVAGMHTAGSPPASHGSPTGSLHATSNFLRPHYGSFECATDHGLEYRWPCSRPGSRD
jgi:hypothetical protein